MVSGGADVATVSGILGHAQVSTFHWEKCGVLRSKTGVCDSEHFSGKLGPVRAPAFLYIENHSLVEVSRKNSQCATFIE